MLTDLGNPSSFDAIFSPSSASQRPVLWRRPPILHLVLQGLEQDWINSSRGQQIDSELNTWAAQSDPAAVSSAGACGLICDGTKGPGVSLTDADGQGGGLLFGSGGRGH